MLVHQGRSLTTGAERGVGHSTREHATEDSVIARFTLTRGDDGRSAGTRAEAVPVRIALGVDAVRVVPADPALTADALLAAVPDHQVHELAPRAR